MGRMGPSDDWDDAMDGSEPRYRDDDRGRARLSSSQVASALREMGVEEDG